LGISSKCQEASKLFEYILKIIKDNVMNAKTLFRHSERSVLEPRSNIFIIPFLNKMILDLLTPLAGVKGEASGQISVDRMDSRYHIKTGSECPEGIPSPSIG
jgi:hypothetical protein